MFEVITDSATRPKSRALRNKSIAANTIIGLRSFVQNASVKKVETVGTCAYYNNTFFLMLPLQQGQCLLSSCRRLTTKQWLSAGCGQNVGWAMAYPVAYPMAYRWSDF